METTPIQTISVLTLIACVFFSGIFLVTKNWGSLLSTGVFTAIILFYLLFVRDT